MLFKFRKCWFAAAVYQGTRFWLPVSSWQALVFQKNNIPLFFGTWEEAIEKEDTFTSKN